MFNMKSFTVPKLEIFNPNQGWKNTHFVREHVREHVLVLEQEQNKNMKNF